MRRVTTTEELKTERIQRFQALFSEHEADLVSKYGQKKYEDLLSDALPPEEVKEIYRYVLSLP
jgi:hypothetical protein